MPYGDIIDSDDEYDDHDYNEDLQPGSLIVDWGCLAFLVFIKIYQTSYE